MSLQVWLPLNKDLKNVGTKNITATKNSSSVVIQNDTDFGNVLYFGAASTNGCIYFPPEEFTGNTAMSVSFYVNFLTFDADYSNLVGFFNSATASDIYDANKIFSFYKHVNTTGTTAQFRFFVSVSTSNYILTNSFSTNTWQHFVLVNKGKNLILYQNGAKINEITVSSNLPYNLIKRVTFGQSNSSNITRHCNAKISDLRIYDHALSEYDVQRIYQNRNTHEIPTVPGSPIPDLPLWVKILHHNVPSSNLFTTANAKKNTTENLYSRLGIYFNSTIFKNPYGKYEFLAKEKLESGSTEQSYQWRQTSSPTASTIAGFEKIKNTNNSERLIGLKSTNSYAAFHNGSSWWCACGSYTAYQGGIPGFGSVVKSGYLDLYAKARIGHLPNDYEELDYIQATGTQYIRTDLIQNIDDRIILEVSFAPSTLSGWFGGNAYTQVQINAANGFTANTKSIALVDYSGRTEYIYNNGELKKTQSWSTSTSYNGIKICLFALGTSSTAAANLNSGKIFYAKLYENGIMINHLIPAKRKSDGVVGMYDLISKKIFINQGTGVFNVGPSVISLPKEYEELEYIEGNGTQYIDTEIFLSNKDKFELKFQRLSTTSSFNPIFGAIGGGESYTSTNNFSLTYMSNNKYAIYCDGAAGNGSYAWLGGDVSDQKIYTISYNGLNVSPIINGSAMTQTTQHTLIENNPTKTTWLFGRNNTGSGAISNSQLKVFYLKMWNNGLMVRHFIPSKRKSDNVIGMYDIVSGQFFINSGTGSFTGA